MDDRQRPSRDMTHHGAWEWAAPLGVLCLGLALRLWRIGGESAWLDEVFSLQHLDAPSLGAFWRALATSDPPAALAPGYFTLAYCWAALWGPSLGAARAFSMLCGLGSILILQRLARRVYGLAASTAAALLLAASLPHIYYAQEARMYALTQLLAILSMATLLYGRAGEGRLRWLPHMLVNALLLWTSIFTGLLIAAQAGWLLCCYRRRPRLLAAWCAAHAAFAASILLWHATRYVDRAFWMPQPGWRELVNAYVVFAGGRFSNDNPAAWLPGGFSLDLPLALLIYALAVWGVWTPPGRRVSALMGALAALPPVMLFLAAVLWKPCFLYRYALFASLPLYALAGTGWARLPHPRLRQAAACALIALFMYQHAVRLHTPFRPDYRAAVAAIHADDARQEEIAPVLVLKEPLNRLPLEYAGLTSPARMIVAHGEGDLHAAAAEFASQRRAFWTVTWRWDRPEAYHDALTRLGAAVTSTPLGGMPPLLLWRAEWPRDTGSSVE